MCLEITFALKLGTWENDVTQRQLLLGLMFLGGSLAFAPPAQAQRSGFIIGVGLGPGLVSHTSVPDRESKYGLAIDFHMGGVIGDSFELYFVFKGTVFARLEVTPPVAPSTPVLRQHQ